MSPIIFDEWVELCGGVWETGDPLPAYDVVYVTCDHIDEFIRNEYDKGKVIISAASDFGPCEQAGNEPWRDLEKWFPMIHDIHRIGYRDLYIPARLNQDRCLSSDKYSIKSYSYTLSTFNRIPENWFCVNSQINNIKIPFGVDRESLNYINKYKTDEKIERVFTCFSNNTNERLYFKRRVQNDPMFFILENVDKDKYYYEMCRSKWVYCPEGNGIDSYRILESIYAGCIPVSSHKLYGIYGSNSAYYTDRLHLTDITLTNIIDFNYWKNKVNEARNDRN